MLNIKYEYKNRFYLGGGGDSNGNFFGQAGFIISFKDNCRNRRGFSSNSRYNDLTDLRIGIKVGDRLGSISQFVGTNYEILLAYNFALCN